MQAHDSMIGAKLPGGIEVKSLIGKGGQAKVYKGYQESLHRYVAVKFPSSLDEKALGRFAREGQRLANLKSDYIVPVYDREEYEGRPYLVMAYIEGPSLDDLIQEAKSKNAFLPLAKVRRYLEHIGRGLADAHRQGVLHRDVKPANVLIDEDQDRAMLVDFGLAKMLRGDAIVSTADAQPGTMAYMAPEQVYGIEDKIDHRCDIWAMGVMLYEMLTGQRPFDRETMTNSEVSNRILRWNPDSVRLDRPDLNPEIDHVMDQSLAKEPDNRFGSAVEFAQEACAVLEKTNDVSWWERFVLTLKRGWRWLTTHIPGPRLLVEIAILVAAIVLIVMQACGGKPTPTDGGTQGPDDPGPPIVIFTKTPTPVLPTDTSTPDVQTITPTPTEEPTTPVPPTETATPVPPTKTAAPEPKDVIVPLETKTEGPGESRFNAVRITGLSTSGGKLHLHGSALLPDKVWGCEYWLVEWCGDDVVGKCGLDPMEGRNPWYIVDGVNARKDGVSGILTSWPVSQNDNAVVWIRLTAKDCDKGRERVYCRFDLRQLGLPLTERNCPN